jgi:heme exporter protein B
VSRTAAAIKALVIKDLLTELRAKEVLPTMVVLGMLITWVFRIVAEAGSQSATVMGPAAVWIAFLFAGLLAQERSFAAEQPQECISGLLLAPVDAGAIYLAKLLVNLVILAIFEIILVPMIMVVFKLHLAVPVFHLLGILILGNIALSSVGTLFSAMVQVSRARGSLLSILVLIILLPMMIPANFALLLSFGLIPEELAGVGVLALAGNMKTAVGFLVAFDTIFVVAGWLLFGFVVRE